MRVSDRCTVAIELPPGVGAVARATDVCVGLICMLSVAGQCLLSCSVQCLHCFLVLLFVPRGQFGGQRGVVVGLVGPVTSSLPDTAAFSGTLFEGGLLAGRQSLRRRICAKVALVEFLHYRW